MESKLINQLENLDIRSEDEEILISIGQKTYSCGKHLLVSKCKYFEALFNFNSKSSKVELDCDMDETIGCSIINFIKTEFININEENFHDLLIGSIFLGCSDLEELVVTYIIKNFSVESAFSMYQLSKDYSCIRLKKAAEKFISKLFHNILKFCTTSSKLDQFLALQEREIELFLQENIQCDERMILLALLGWMVCNETQMKKPNNLLSHVNFDLIHKSHIKNISKDESYSLILHNYQHPSNLLPPSKQSKMIENLPPYAKRWPQLLVTLLPGKCGSKKLQYIDLTEKFPQWRFLSRKTVSLDLLSGFSMVYLYPRIYFLGERKWHIHCYDVQLDEWAILEDISLPKLLSGNVTHKNELHLIGGVNVEEWNRGNIELTTSCSVDTINMNTLKWHHQHPLPMNVSNPSVACFKNYIYSFGGLQSRKPKRQSFRLNMEDGGSGWEEITELPEVFCYPAICADYKRNGIWIIGGMRIPERHSGHVKEMKEETYLYKPDEDAWIQKPSLSVPRKSAFVFEVNCDIFVCGGTGEDLKQVIVTEVLRKGSDKWEILRSNIRYPCSINNSVILHKPSRLIKT